MITKYTTKRDTNGNRYTLMVNHNRKEFMRSYNPYSIEGFITITKKDRNKLINQLLENGYTEV